MKTMRLAIVIGDFHKPEMAQMLASATAMTERLGLELAEVVKVPGAYEKPLAVKRLMLKPDIDGVAVLGIIERGETAHGRVMAQTVSDAIVRLELEFMKPVGVGIIGPEIDPPQFASRMTPHAEAAVFAVATMLGVQTFG